MSCGYCPYLYRSLPILYSLLALVECGLGVTRAIFFFQVKSVYTITTTAPITYSRSYVVAFIIDWISSTVPTLMGLLVVLLLLVFAVHVMARYRIDPNKETAGERAQHYKQVRNIIAFFTNGAVHRLLTLNCNCPCHKAQPKLRFQLRLTFLLVSLILRIVAIALYATAPAENQDHGLMAILCGASLVLLLLTLLLDVYRYQVWWYYTPQNDTRCCRSSKHERYIPYHMIGDNRDAQIFGDRPCNEQPCRKTTLDHIAVFHARNYQPQRRWSDIKNDLVVKHPFCCARCQKKDNQPHHIGFHTTTPEAAIAIARSNFRPSSKGMLGAGVYCARSVEGTDDKANSYGAWIVAEIRMGKVYEIEKPHIMPGHSRYDHQLAVFVRSSQWHGEYDTCYLIHDQDRLNEFCIKDPEIQIIKWTIVIEKEFDNKVSQYGLDTEFNSTKWCCI